VKILSINISHHPSICLYENNKILEFYNEERFILKKNYQVTDKTEIYQSILQKVKHKPDVVVYCSYGRNLEYSITTDKKIIKNLQKQLNNPTYYFDVRKHHIYHAISAFYFSEFEEAAAIVVDGGGACEFYMPYQEIESIYFINKKNITPVYKHNTCYQSNSAIGINTNTFSIFKYVNGVLNKFSDESKGGLDFLNACKAIGYTSEQGYAAGKVMGLSSYAYTDKKFNLDYDKVNIAKNAQEKTFNETCELIDRISNISNNIVLSGGYFLNCSNNFKYVKKYPNLNFFVDPIAHDGGTAIGAALYYDHYK
jgi:carbamoyltransferase